MLHEALRLLGLPRVWGTSTVVGFGRQRGTRTQQVGGQLPQDCPCWEARV